jgi:diaminopimelate decarboxylase
LFLRECYEPGKWPHRFFLLSEHQHSTEVNTDIGGPLCFGGDYIAKSVRLPEAHENDQLVIMDTGANSYALWSMHCSRPFPKVIGYDGKSLCILKDRQSSEEAIALWS